MFCTLLFASKKEQGNIKGAIKYLLLSELSGYSVESGNRMQNKSSHWNPTVPITLSAAVLYTIPTYSFLSFEAFDNADFSKIQ